MVKDDLNKGKPNISATQQTHGNWNTEWPPLVIPFKVIETKQRAAIKGSDVFTVFLLCLKSLLNKDISLKVAYDSRGNLYTEYSPLFPLLRLVSLFISSDGFSYLFNLQTWLLSMVVKDSVVYSIASKSLWLFSRTFPIINNSFPQVHKLCVSWNGWLVGENKRCSVNFWVR